MWDASQSHSDSHFPARESGDEGAMDRQWLRQSASDSYGASALHGLDPAGMAMRLEEYDPRDLAASERDALRCEIFSGFAEYLFADGPAPSAVRDRIEGFLQSFHPDLAASITGPAQWVTDHAVAAVLRKKQYAAHFKAQREAACSRGSLSTWSRALATEHDQQTIKETIVKLIAFITSEGRSWRILTAVAYGLAKALRPHLIAGMSLHDIAILSGDAGGRATPCDRIKRLYNRRIAAAGARATNVHFQKSPRAAAAYASVQEGNSNRSKAPKKKTPKKKPKRK